MQLKGLVKFFTAALILISLYQLSFTFVVRNVEKKARAKAERLAKAENPQAKGAELEKLVNRYFPHLLSIRVGSNQRAGVIHQCSRPYVHIVYDIGKRGVGLH